MSICVLQEGAVQSLALGRQKFGMMEPRVGERPEMPGPRELQQINLVTDARHSCLESQGDNSDAKTLSSDLNTERVGGI